MQFCIKDFLSKCDQICSFLWIWLQLLKKSLNENFKTRPLLQKKKKKKLSELASFISPCTKKILSKIASSYPKIKLEQK